MSVDIYLRYLQGFRVDRLKPKKSSVKSVNNCYLGPSTVVARGVNTGDSCVIGASSLVPLGVPSGSKAWRSPA